MMTPVSSNMDVILTAGDRQGSRPVLGENKAFLPLAGVPLIHHVLAAVERARCTARIFVVGDKARLETVLAAPHSPFRGTCPVLLIEQGDTLYDNIWTAFLHTLPDGLTAEDAGRTTAPAIVDKAVLVMPGDIPLATPFEIDEFVDACDLSRYDYCLGLTTAPTLAAYYPQAGRPGIRMAYYTLRDLEVRHNNLHLVKPLRLGNRHYVQKMYDLRYQREWHNMLKLCWELWRTQDASLRMVWSFLSLHLAGAITRRGWPHSRLVRPFFLDLPMVASQMSQLLRTRFTAVETHYGGCTLDVDNAEHYRIICANFDAWRAYQHALAKELKRPG